MRISDWSSDVCSSDLTENAQPAIMANAIATLRVLEKEGGLMLADKADYVAGHSLGEYSALCGAQALDLATTSRLLKLRGRAMQAAVPVGEGAMAAQLGRASCRESVCQYVSISVVAVSLKKKKTKNNKQQLH